MDPDRRLDRRTLLLAGAGLVVVGSACSGNDGPADPARRSSRTRPEAPPSASTPATATPPATTAPTSATPAGALLPSTAPWEPNAGDHQPGVKVTAARVVEAIGAWPAGQGGPNAAARRVEALGQNGHLGRASYPPLHQDAAAAAIEVIEAQWGGVLPTTASVMVVCRQWYADEAGQVTPGGTTIDERLTRAAPHWRVTSVHPGVLPPPSRPVSRLARAVLSQPRIEPPPAARADVASGGIHDSVLLGMLRLARTYRIGVTVVRSGHPRNVFGIDRASDHTMGRAFDTWRINDHVVVDPATPRGLVTGYMHAAAAAGSYNIGGPYVLTDGSANFFTDSAHHDHVHVAFAT